MSVTATPTPVTRATWTIDPSHLEVGFAVRHLMISTVKGHFSGVTGTVALDGEDFTTAVVRVDIDANTVDTREPKRDEHLRSADFFNVAEFPRITFQSRRVERVPGSTTLYTLVGDLTIRGITREVHLQVAAEGLVRDPWGFERAGFHAHGAINRKDFGLTWNVALETGGVVVGDEVKLNFEIEIVKPAAQ